MFTRDLYTFVPDNDDTYSLIHVAVLYKNK